MSKTFIVTMSELYGKEIKVQAETKDEAIEKVRLSYDDDQVVKERFIDSTYVDCEEIKDEQ